MLQPLDLSQRNIVVSIIVPLEAHRDQALESVRAWATAQTYPRQSYQLVLSAPVTLDAGILAQLRQDLQEWDRIEVHACEHDIALIAAAAPAAAGRILLFTESHCLPQPEALTHLMRTIDAHPEWAGFSSATTPVTHNFLSQIEAGIYDRDIRAKLADPAALKVVDQCFLIRREVYFSCGGFEPRYGHFAEWLLSASLRRDGHVIGFDLTPVLRHYYVGNMRELETFTLDFARGQIRFAAEHPDDPRHISFNPLPELAAHCERVQEDFRCMLRLRIAALKAALARAGKSRDAGLDGKRLLSLGGDCLLWALTRWRGIGGACAHARLAVVLARWRLAAAVRRTDRVAASSAYIDWFGKLVHRGRLEYLATTAVVPHRQRNPNFARSGGWRPDRASGVELHGFYELEVAQGRPIMWSQHCACIYLPLHVGRYRIVIEWEPVRPMRADAWSMLEFDGRQVAPADVSVHVTRLAVEVTSGSQGVHRLAFGVMPFAAAGDGRLLGLPLSRISWSAVDAPVGGSECVTALAGQTRPVYFLHVPKCAGTATRLLLENAFSANAIFAPYLGGYYADNLFDNPAIEQPYQFYRGHFGWLLPDILPARDMAILTILRDPADRVVSLFYYLQQHGRLQAGMGLAEWIDQDFKVGDTIVSQFAASRQHALAVQETLRAGALGMLPQAVANLRSCRIVGLSERLEEAVNVFAWDLGFLPPLLLPRNNVTVSRPAARDLSASVRARIEYLLAADFALYEEAVVLFETAFARMREALPAELGAAPDTASVRIWLRQRYLRRMAGLASRNPDPERIDWRPDDVFHGENLHEREQHGGQGLRWTGPNETTRFLLYLGQPRGWEIRARLHPATPHTHAEAASLRVNGCELPFLISHDGSAYVLASRIPREASMLSECGVATFELNAPTTRGAGEFRMLGLALMQLSLQAE